MNNDPNRIIEGKDNQGTKIWLIDDRQFYSFWEAEQHQKKLAEQLNGSEIVMPVEPDVPEA